MDGLDGDRADHRARHGRRPGAPVIVLTTFDLDEYVLSAIRAGASGFLLKDAPPEEMLAAIRTVHRGDAVIAPLQHAGGSWSTSSPRCRPTSPAARPTPRAGPSPTSPTASARCSC